ncbi:MAG TPA: DegT/DnrJ/EryC1/StrS family aminotransferase, partial [Bacteroidales bacterium]|nr:DegT/DnrJ/EryC1/StrS family aminotransferase [Bacteroidales bacterium]
FAASANCIRYCGGEVVFADIDPHTYLLDPNTVEHLLQSSPPGTYQGIVPVDFAGYPADLERFRELADRYGLWILEDACHAPGGYFTDSSGNAQHCGNGKYAELAIFSFHPVKHIATGEGGMITTNDQALYEKLMLLRTHGITKDPALMQDNHGPWYYEMQELGYNYRLTDFQAALGISQLERAAQGLSRRQAIARRYDDAFAGKSLHLPWRDASVFHAFHLYVIQSPDRAGLYDHLRRHGILAQVHYIPVHLQPYYRQYGWKPGDLPIAEAYYTQCLSLPMYPAHTEEEQEFVINRVLEYLPA